MTKIPQDLNTAVPASPPLTGGSARPRLPGEGDRGAPMASALPILGLVALAFAIRIWLFGDPVVHVDEEFYFLAGGRLLHGALPFVDVWDRKPIGLFLIYAGAYAIGGGSVIAYQILATISAAATALLIRRLALHVADARAAWIMAAAYLLYLMIFSGAGGQSPVFYNLPMVGAVLLLVNDVEGLKSRRSGMLAMLLVGVALQIKYSAVFEGIFLGCWLLWLDHRKRRSFPVSFANALLWAGSALLPTFLALGFYAWIGHGHEFIQANFLSVFGRREPIISSLGALANTILPLLPLITSVSIGVKRLRISSEGRLLLGWVAAATFGYLVFGNYYDHYALALLPPFCAAGAAGLIGPFGKRYLAPALLLTAGSVGAYRTVVHVRHLGNAAQVKHVTNLIQSNLNGCLFVFEGHAMLYETSHACFVSRYVFPFHLSQLKEGDALGVNVMAEMRRIDEASPSVIVMAVNASPGDTNPATRGYLLAMVRTKYRLVGVAPIGSQEYAIFARRPTSGKALKRPTGPTAKDAGQLATDGGGTALPISSRYPSLPGVKRSIA